MKTTKKFIKHAQDFRQYDRLAWEVEGGKESPSRAWYRTVLFAYGPKFAGKSVIDIGSGVGQIFPFLKKRGAKEIIGLEPSRRNFALSKKLHPEVIVYKNTLQKTQLKKKFDIAIILLTFEHVLNVDAAFKTLSRLLKKGGYICLTTVDKFYAETQRFGYDLEVAPIDGQSSVTRTTRADQIMWDIVRLAEVYIKAANENGFALQKHVHMKPPKSFIAKVPKYKRFAKTVMHHFYVFKKV